MDSSDSLYQINTSNAIAIPLGKIGYYSAGDFAFMTDTLFLSASNNHLIKITLNQSKTSILNVKDVGLMTTGIQTAYSLFTSSKSCNYENNLYALAGLDVYKINTNTANAVYECSMTDIKSSSSGAATISDFNSSIAKEILFPNVFTPNSDGINDVFKINLTTGTYNEVSINVYSRWGQIVYNSKSIDFIWDGRNKCKEDLPDGVYFFVFSSIDECSNEMTKSGFISLFR